MTSDSESKRPAGRHARSKASAPVIDLTATDMTSAGAGTAPTADEAPVVPDEGATAPTTAAGLSEPENSSGPAEIQPEAPAIVDSATETVSAPEVAPDDAGAGEQVRPDDTDTTALLSEVPPSAESAGAETHAGAPGGVTGLLAAAFIGGVVALGGGFGALYFAGLNPLAAHAPATAELGALKAEIADVSARLAAVSDNGGLADRLTALEATVGVLGSGPATGDTASANDVVALRQQLDGLADRIGSLKTADPADLGAVRSQMAALSKRLDAVEAAVMSTRTLVDDSSLKADERLARVEKRLDAGPKGGEIAALSVAATSLAGKIDAGQPFAVDYKLVASAAPDLAGLDVLGRLAATGVPTLDALLTGMPVEAMMARRPVARGVSWIDSLVASAESLVNYRQTGLDADDPASRAIETVRAALRSGDAAAARQAATSLPDWAKAGATDWLQRLDQRTTADQAVAELTARVVERLKAPTTAQ